MAQQASKENRLITKRSSLFSVPSFLSLPFPFVASVFSFFKSTLLGKPVDEDINACKEEVNSLYEKMQLIEQKLYSKMLFICKFCKYGDQDFSLKNTFDSNVIEHFSKSIDADMTEFEALKKGIREICQKIDTMEKNNKNLPTETYKKLEEIEQKVEVLEDNRYYHALKIR